MSDQTDKRYGDYKTFYPLTNPIAERCNTHFSQRVCVTQPLLQKA